MNRLQIIKVLQDFILQDQHGDVEKILQVVKQLKEEWKYDI